MMVRTIFVALLAVGAEAFLAPQTFVRPQHHVLFMGWGPEPVWTSAKLISKQDACKSAASVSVVVELDPESSKEYKVPGQYVQVRLNEETKPLFLAISSPPSDEGGAFEFLIKKTEGNEWLTTASAGTAVEISQVRLSYSKLHVVCRWLGHCSHQGSD